VNDTARGRGQGTARAAIAAASAARLRASLVWCGATVLLLWLSGRIAEVDPAFLWVHRAAVGDYAGRLLTLDSGGLAPAHPAEWFWNLRVWGRLLLETIIMSYVGTGFGLAFGFLLGMRASVPFRGRRLWQVLAKRTLEFLRTVPDLVFALVFVAAFGLGPLAGVLAIALHSAGALGKLFAEAADNIDAGPVEGVLAAGGTRLAAIRYGALPQLMPIIAGYTLLRFEINVRDAAIMGYVGAGGIGLSLIEAIQRFYYTDVSAILVLIIGTVMVIDAGTSVLRRRLLAVA
jgi:phosphonate transport system permease protein